MATLKMAVNWFEDQLSPNAGEVLQKAPRGAFCNTFDLH